MPSEEPLIPAAYGDSRALPSWLFSLFFHAGAAILLILCLRHTEELPHSRRALSFALVAPELSEAAVQAPAEALRVRGPKQQTPKLPAQSKPSPAAAAHEAAPSTADAAASPIASTNSSSSEVFSVPAREAGSGTGKTAGTASGSGSARRIGSGAALDNVNFEPLYTPRPSYPPAALRDNISGWVDVDLLIDEKGRVQEATVTDYSGHPAFPDAVKKVVSSWRFPPPRIQGKAVMVRYVYRVKFTVN